MSYSTTPPPGDLTQQLPPQDDQWWKKAIGAVGGFLDSVSRLFRIGSEYPKPLPLPLAFTDQQIASMLSGNPTLKAEVITKIMGQGHLHLFLGYTPTRSQLEESNLLTARFARWLGDGTGDDLSRGEAEIRAMILQGMFQLAPATAGGTVPGGGPNLPGPSLEAGAGSAASIITIVGAGLWLGSKFGEG